MKKLLSIVILGVVFFIGGQWIGLEVQARKQVAQEADEVSGGNASPALEAPVLDQARPDRGQ